MQPGFNSKARAKMSPQAAAKLLFNAIQSDNLSAVDVLLNQDKADPDAMRDGLPLLHFAAQLKRDKALGMLLAAGANVHALDNGGHSVLRHAMESGSEITVKKTLEAGADTFSTSFNPQTGRLQTDVSYSTNCDFEIATAVHSVSERFELNDAACRSDTIWMKKMLAEETPPDTFDRFGKTAAVWCCEKGNAEGLRVLLESKADPNLAMKDGNAPAHAAAQSGSVKLLQQLAEAGANLKAANKAGRTPLDIAKAEGNREAIDYITERLATEDGALVKGATELGKSIPLMKKIRIAKPPQNKQGG